MASLGIDERHLNKSIAQLQPHFRSLHRKFGFHICGEGGEYETFTLDCPLYKRRLEPTGVRVTRHAEDASVAVLQFDGLARHQKPVVAEAEAAMAAAVSAAVAAGKAAAAGDEEAEAGAAGAAEKEEAAAEAAAAAEATREGIAWWLSDGITGGTATKAATAATAAVAAAAPEAAAGHVWLEAVPGGLMHVVARGEAKPREEPSSSPAAQEAATAEAAASAAAAQLTAALERVVKALGARGLTLGNVLFVRLYVAQMAHYATVNKAYSAFFAGHAPAARAAVQLPLGGGGGDGGGSGGGAGGGEDALVVLEAVACGAPKRLLHVQSISEWAPRMIGPYCQMTEAHGVALVAGNLGLDPATMTLVEGGTAAQAEKALDNCAAVLGGLSFTARSTLQLCAYVTAEADAAAVRRAVRGWLHRHKVGRGGGKGDGEAASKAEFKGEAGGGDAAWEDAAAVVVVQVGALPMGALVEIQIEAATAEAPPLARRSYRVRRGNLDVACRLTVGGVSPAAAATATADATAATTAAAAAPVAAEAAAAAAKFRQHAFVGRTVKDMDAALRQHLTASTATATASASAAAAEAAAPAPAEAAPAAAVLPAPVALATLQCLVGATEAREVAWSELAEALSEARAQLQAQLTPLRLRASRATHARAFCAAGAALMADGARPLRRAILDAMGGDSEGEGEGGGDGEGASGCTVVALPVERLPTHGSCRLALQLHFAVVREA